MAANWKSGAGGIASFGKRLLDRNSASRSRHPIPPAFASASTNRSAHASAYDKNLDDQLRPTVVPDEVIQPLSDKYWAPDPHTGVFGPATESAGRVQAPCSSLAKGSLNSVLEETAWFRPTSIEDLEKPHHH